MHDFTGFTTKSIKETKKEIVDITKQTNKQMLMQLSASESVPDNKEDNEEAVPEKKLILENLTKGFNRSRVL